MTFPDKKTDLLVKMLAALEGSKGTLDWEDIATGAMRVAERKKQEAVAALLGSYPLTDILTIVGIASKEALLARSKNRFGVIVEQPTSSKAGKKRRAG